MTGRKNGARQKYATRQNENQGSFPGRPRTNDEGMKPQLSTRRVYGDEIDPDDRNKEICGHCNSRCVSRGKGSDGLLCDCCGQWVHASCEGMTLEDYRMFVVLAEKVPNMSYYCELNQCKKVSSEILKQIGPIRKMVEVNTERIEELEKRFVEQEASIEQKISHTVEEYVSDIIEDKIKRTLVIERDRISRQKNVILMNVKESTAETGAQRKEHDLEFVKRLLSDTMNLDINQDIRNVVRLRENQNEGANVNEGNRRRPRLMKVMLNSEENARKILYNASKLETAGEVEIRAIKIFRDLSKEDRDARNRLVAEMKQKNEALERDGVTDFRFIIRGEMLFKVRVDPSKRNAADRPRPRPRSGQDF